MNIYPKTYTIKEYDGFSRGGNNSSFHPLDTQTFDALEAFILANKSAVATDVVELLSLSTRRGTGRVITARNYVGIIAMNNGTIIEILPKIYGDIDETKTRDIFLKMLRTLKDVSFKEFTMTRLKADRLNLFEIFIKMFLDEVAVVTKQGLRSSYMPQESNERFYKGKLLTSQHLKHNLCRKDRFFVCIDEFSINRPENRLLKSTLVFLMKRTNDARNRQAALRLLSYLDGIDSSVDYRADFSACSIGRGMTHYAKALAWCRVFLLGNSFTSFTGSNVAFSLLFPMEKIFENFVAAKIRKLAGQSLTVRTQDSQYSLFDTPFRAFSLRPDIVIQERDATIVLDTKWKILPKEVSSNHGIAQSDMYQAYAYGKKYNAGKVMLLYPLTGAVKEKVDLRYASKDGVIVEVAFIDLLNPDESVSELLYNVRAIPRIIFSD